MKATFKDNILYCNGIDIIQFPLPIDQIIEFNNSIVVLISRDFHKQSNENVYCVNLLGQIIWQVPKYSYVYSRSPFVALTNHENNVKLINWDSSYVIIEPETGTIIVDAFQSRKGRRPW